LEKVRNGKPGEWQMEWSEGRFNLMDMPVPAIERELNIKVG
jgi:protein ImuA